MVLVTQFYSDRAQISPNLFLARAVDANRQIQRVVAQRPFIADLDPKRIEKDDCIARLNASPSLPAIEELLRALSVLDFGRVDVAL